MSKNVLEITPEFRKLIKKLLMRAKLRPGNIKKLMDETSMKMFREAFIHKSYSQDYNYEFYELEGDTILNHAVVKWLLHTFPKIVNVDWLTHMKISLISGKTLGILAFREGFFEHILYGEDYHEIFKNAKNIEHCQEYKDMLEDTFEAFLGVLDLREDELTTIGVGSRACYNIVKSFLDEYRNQGHITLDYHEYYDPISRLKEIYDKYHWDFGKSRHYDIATQQATVWGYPKYDKTRKLKNKVILAKNVQGATKDEAQKKAAEQALQVLCQRYKIKWDIPDPYKKNVYKKKKTPKTTC